MKSENKFALYENNKPISVLGSLSEAKQAVQSKNNTANFRVELNAAPAKSRIWVFDYHTADWVEQL